MCGESGGVRQGGPAVVELELRSVRQNNAISPTVSGEEPKFQGRVASLGIKVVKTAFRSPWQNPFVERLIGSVRRECLDHFIVLGQRHLKRILAENFQNYNEHRAHQGLDGNSPVGRNKEPPTQGEVVSIPFLVGLHHRYTRRKAA